MLARMCGSSLGSASATPSTHTSSICGEQPVPRARGLALTRTRAVAERNPEFECLPPRRNENPRPPQKATNQKIAVLGAIDQSARHLPPQWSKLCAASAHDLKSLLYLPGDTPEPCNYEALRS